MVRGSKQKFFVVVVEWNSIEVNFKFVEICMVFLCLNIFFLDKVLGIWCLSIGFSLLSSNSSCMSHIYAVSVFFQAKLCSHGLKFCRYEVYSESLFVMSLYVMWSAIIKKYV